MVDGQLVLDPPLAIVAGVVLETRQSFYHKFKSLLSSVDRADDLIVGSFRPTSLAFA